MFKQKSPVKKKFAAPLKAKKQRRQWDPRTRAILRQVIIGLSILVIIALLVTAVWYGTRVSFLTITTVTVEGGETINHETVKKTVEGLLEGNYVGLVPRRFAWTYPDEEILEQVRTIPRVKDPVLERVSGTAINISFSEYIPHALWCQGRDSEECYFIDDTGYAFTRAPQLEGGTFPRFHTIGTDAKERTVMIPTDDLRAIETLREALSGELGLPIAFVETDMVRDVFLGVAGGGEIKATLRMSSEETISNLKSILASKEFSDIKPGSFQYIDLRFGNKVFINEEAPGSRATSTATSSEPVSEVTAPANEEDADSTDDA
ncbi:MAG: cell division protein FtsQ/DivIB [Candidatus Paceibacteria bacterium]